MKIGRMTTVLVLALLLLGTAAWAAPERKTGGNEKEIIQGLKAGIGALSALGRHDEAEHLERVLKEYLGKLEAKKARAKAGPKSEIEVVRWRIGVLRIAMKGLLEKDAIDAASLVEHRIHMYELALEGRKDEEAKKIRESAPKPEAMVNPLRKAGEIWKEFGHEVEAKKCHDLAIQYHEQAKKHAARKKPGATEKDMLRRHMEILRIARHGLLEAEKKDAAHRIEQVLHVYELAIEGQREKALKAREKAPNSGQLTELLFHASKIWAKFGHEKKAADCEELGKLYQQRWKQQKEQEKRAAAAERERAAEQRERAAEQRERTAEQRKRDADTRQRELTEKLLRKIEDLEKRIRELEKGK